MKKLLFFLILINLNLNVFGQISTLGFDFQALVRDLQGNIKSNTTVDLKFGLYPTQSATTPTWEEIQTAKTDTFGVVNVTIGEGTKNSGTVANFSDVDFSTSNYWIKTEMKNGTSYVLIGYEKLNSVPYAKVAGNASIIPPGLIMAFGGDTTKIPNGWLLCNGKEVARSGKYQELYKVIGTNWGKGTNGLTFNLPDFRGQFLRGVDNGAGNDPDTANRTSLKVGGNVRGMVGSYQDDAVQGHNHYINSNLSGTPSGDYTTVLGVSSTAGGFQLAGGGKFYNNSNISVAEPRSDGTHGTPRTSFETRPNNVYVYYIIKY